jgi:hypothetical protein
VDESKAKQQGTGQLGAWLGVLQRFLQVQGSSEAPKGG